MERRVMAGQTPHASLVVGALDGNSGMREWSGRYEQGSGQDAYPQEKLAKLCMPLFGGSSFHVAR
jgi:hypothetical protein